MKTTSESDSEEVFDVTDTFSKTVCPVADELNQNTIVHAGYGFVEGFNLAYSTLKYFFDLKHAEDNQIVASDDLHLFMTSPLGAFVTLVTTSFIIATSVLANTFDKKNGTNKYQLTIATYFPYLRDALKTTKNALKGVRNTIFAIGLLLKDNYKHLIFPLSLILGIPSLFNRLLIRSMDNELKSTMNSSKSLLTQVMGWGKIYLADKMPSPRDKQYANNYVFIHNATTQQLVYINPEKNADNKEVIILDEASTKNLSVQLNKLKEKEKEKLIANAIRNGKTDKEAELAAEIYLKKNKNIYIQPGMLELTEILSFSVLEGHTNNFKQRISNHYEKATPSFTLQLKRYVSKGYNGFIDGLYLFMGPITAAVFAPEIFITIAILSSVYVLANILNRLYEEHKDMNDLHISQIKLKHATSLFELEQALSRAYEFNDTTDIRIKKHFSNTIEEKMQAFLKTRIDLKSAYAIPQHLAFFIGLQRGLMAYSALTSLMYCALFLYFVSGVMVPPMLVFGCVIGGAAILSGFITHSLLFLTSTAQPDETDCATNEIKNEVDHIKNLLDKEHCVINDERKRNIKRKFTEGMILDPTPQFFFQELSETLRSIFASFSKGQKEIEFLFNMFQEKDQDGHYRDSSFMIKLMVPVGILLSAAFGVRTFAKEFSGKDCRKQVPVPVPVPVSAPVPGLATKESNNNIKFFPAAAPSGSDAPPSPSMRRQTSYSSFFNGIYRMIDITGQAVPAQIVLN